MRPSETPGQQRGFSLMAQSGKPTILLVDDNQSTLDGLESQLRTQLTTDKIDVKSWKPHEDDDDIEEAFNKAIGTTTALVVTDYDLSTGIKGLFGPIIVEWCQNRLIPVGDYSRKIVTKDPGEPNLFEIRVPSNDAEAALFIKKIFDGFSEIRSLLQSDRDNLLGQKNLASILANILRRPMLSSQFGLYMGKLGIANSILIHEMRKYASDSAPSDDQRLRLTAYVLGHVFLNMILKYPGPILSEEAFCAYLATSIEESGAISSIFDSARYHGPFAGNSPMYWRDKVDILLDDLGAELAGDQFESFSDYNRRAVECRLGRSLAKHRCSRCDGIKGGFWCPFTMRAVCEREDCSVPSCSWIPDGAQLSRVERDFFDEWAPILGF